MKTATIIVNPTAGKGRGDKVALRLSRELDGLGYLPEIVRTAGPGDATVHAEEAAGRELCVSVGGDGTLHEVANGLVAIAEADRRPVLGIVPVGSGNDYVKTLGGPADADELLDLIRADSVRRVDIGRTDGEVFVNNLGLGLDALATAEARRYKDLVGPAAYAVGLFRAVRQHDAPPIECRLDDRTVEGRFLSVSVGIGRVCGGGFWLTPDALPNDGLFDVTFIRDVGILRTLPHLWTIKQGRHRSLSFVEMHLTRRLEVRAPGPFLVHEDGEVRWASSGKLSLRCDPGVLRVLAP